MEGLTPPSLGDVRQPGDDTFTDVDNPYGRSKVRMGGSAAYGDAGGQRRMQDWHQAWATQALRVLKPGGHLLAFGGTRTYHRLACAVEDAGFEIRDSVIWLYGSGFPKSLSVGKAIDKAAGAEREVVGKAERHSNVHSFADPDAYSATDFKQDVTAPATPEAAQWEGWGTALKPAHEPIVVARKPLTGTVAANVLEHGTGALNIDGTRIGADVEEMRGRSGVAEKGNQILGAGIRNPTDEIWEPSATGRWPPNVVLSREAAEELDEQSGESVSRFFYQAKAGRSERTAGVGANAHPT